MQKRNGFLLLIFSLLLTFSLSVSAASVNDLLHNPNDPVAGNPKGDITVVEFFDYQCSHCISMGPVISQILRTDPHVRVVFKEFPIRGPQSTLAARAALAAKKQGKYLLLSHALLASNQPLSEETILEIAKEKVPGINVAVLKHDMNSNAVVNEIKANYQLAESLSVNVTPVFFVGKSNATSVRELNMMLGSMSVDELQKAIHQARNN